MDTMITVYLDLIIDGSSSIMIDGRVCINIGVSSLPCARIGVPLLLKSCAMRTRVKHRCFIHVVDTQRVDRANLEDRKKGDAERRATETANPRGR